MKIKHKITHKNYYNKFNGWDQEAWYQAGEPTYESNLTSILHTGLGFLVFSSE